MLLLLVRCLSDRKYPTHPTVLWTGTDATRQILGAGDLVDEQAMADFLERCQFKYGGLAKAPGEKPGRGLVVF